jgi:hypothetical protein
MAIETARADARQKTPGVPSLQGGRLPRASALGIAITGTLLAASGIVLALFRYVVPVSNPFSVYPHPWWVGVIMVHVLSAPPFFFFVGSVWWRHAVRHWRAGQRRLSGTAVVAVAVFAAASGYTLYFVGSEWVLALTRWLHAGGGLAATVLYAFHAVRGARALRSEDLR